MLSCIVITCRFILCLFCVRIIAANIPECEFLNVIELLGQLFYILAQLFLGNLGVHLRGLDVFVTSMELTVSIGTPLERQTEVANECLETCQESGLVIPHFFPNLLSERRQLL